jgi:hypothetical protein
MCTVIGISKSTDEKEEKKIFPNHYRSIRYLYNATLKCNLSFLRFKILEGRLLTIFKPA